MSVPHCPLALPLAVLLASLTGCTPPWDLFSPCEDGTGCAPGSTNSTGTTTTTSAAPPTDGIQTVTSATSSPEPEETTSTSTTGIAGNEPPVIESFGLSPDPLTKPLAMLHLGEAGPTLLHITASDDATEIRLTHNGELLAELPPQDFPYTYEVLSAKFNGLHTFEAVAVDAEGLESTPAVATLSVEAPASGTEKCIFDEDRDDVAIDASSVAALVYADDAIVVVGTRDTGAGPRLAVWKLGRDQCELLPGWPKTGFGQLGSKMSTGTAVALDDDGNLYVAGLVFDPVTPQRYLAKLNSKGSLLWDDLGQAGEVIAGVAVAPPGQAAVFAVGWRQSTPDPTPTDAAIWMYKLDGTEFPPDYLKAPLAPGELPDDENKRSERLRAVEFVPGAGLAFAVGEREFRAAGDVNSFTRMFVVRIHPLNGPAGTIWTSPGEFFLHDAGLGAGVCGNEVIVAGWRGDGLPDPEPAAMLQWFANDGTPAGVRPIPLSSAELRGVACDRELKVVGGGAHGIKPGDAKVLGTPGLEGPVTWYESGTPGADEAAGVACDRRGFCAWGGFRSDGIKRYAVVRAHHP